MKKEVYLATGMENNLRPLDKLRIELKLSNGGVYSSFARSLLYLGTENQS